VSQYDVTLGSAAAINASRVIVGIVWNATTFFGGSAQLAPDGKIYIVPTSADSLSVVNYPDSAGLACNFVVAGLYLGGRLNDHGLPNIVVKASSPCAAPVSFFAAADTVLCANECINFTNLSVNATTYQWNFFGGTPAFDVTLIAGNGTYYDTLTLTNYITVNPAPPTPAIVQSGDTLFAQQGYTSYQWYFGSDTISGATDYFYVATQSGNYNLAVTNEFSCGVGAGIVNVIAKAAPPDLPKGEELFVHPNPSHGKFEVTFYSEKNTFAVFEIVNSIGQIIFRKEKQIKQGRNSLYFGDGWGEADGIYLLKLSLGEKIFCEKIIVSH
jgi:hypothetical protein